MPKPTSGLRVRNLFSSFKPYEWEPSDEQIATSLGLRADRIIRCDMNTSPFIPSRWLERLALGLPQIEVNRYPDTSYSDLRGALSNYASVDADQIVVSNGADEAIDIIAKTFIDAGDEAIISAPSFPMFRVFTELMNGKVVEVSRREGFKDDIEGLLRAIPDRARLVFLCSPNNPTGNSTNREKVVRLLEESGCAVVVDEAYYEFCGKSVIDLTAKYDNLIVVRTLSKAFSIAGARVGYMVASRGTVEALNKARPPNSLSVISLALALIALEEVELMRRNVEKVVRERERCASFLRGCEGVQVYPSEANFILFRLKKGNASDLHKMLMKRGIVLRSFSGTPSLDGCLRFTVGLPEHNDAFIKAMREILANF